MADEESPWPHALNSCRKTGLVNPEGHATHGEREAGEEDKVAERDTRRQQGKDRCHEGDKMGDKKNQRELLSVFISKKKKAHRLVFHFVLSVH